MFQRVIKDFVDAYFALAATIQRPIEKPLLPGLLVRNAVSHKTAHTVPPCDDVVNLQKQVWRWVTPPTREAGEQITNVASGFSGCAGSEEAQQRLNVVVLNNLQESLPTLCLPIKEEAGSGGRSLFSRRPPMKMSNIVQIHWAKV